MKQERMSLAMDMPEVFFVWLTGTGIAMLFSRKSIGSPFPVEAD